MFRLAFTQDLPFLLHSRDWLTLDAGQAWRCEESVAGGVCFHAFPTLLKRLRMLVMHVTCLVFSDLFRVPFLVVLRQQPLHGKSLFLSLVLLRQHLRKNHIFHNIWPKRRLGAPHFLGLLSVANAWMIFWQVCWHASKQRVQSSIGRNKGPALG